MLVIDAFGSVPSGGIIGDNLGSYIWKTTGAGFVIDGGIRDLEGIAPYDMAGYFRGATPPSIHDLMVTGINIPVRIGLTILLIEHVMRAVMALATHVLVMHHGAAIANGTPAEVVRDRAVIDSYLGAEAVA